METKKWYQSKGIDGGLATIAGAIAMIIVMVLKHFGIDAVSETDNIVNLIIAAVTCIGGLLAIIGRLKAKTTIGRKP